MDELAAQGTLEAFSGMLTCDAGIPPQRLHRAQALRNIFMCVRSECRASPQYQPPTPSNASSMLPCRRADRRANYSPRTQQPAWICWSLMQFSECRALATLQVVSGFRFSLPTASCGEC
jgi:hypothetical protein